MTLKLPHPLRKQELKCGRNFRGKNVAEISLERVAAELGGPTPPLRMEGDFLMLSLVRGGGGRFSGSA